MSIINNGVFDPMTCIEQEIIKTKWKLPQWTSKLTPSIKMTGGGGGFINLVQPLPYIDKAFALSVRVIFQYTQFNYKWLQSIT